MGLGSFIGKVGKRVKKIAKGIGKVLRGAVRTLAGAFRSIVTFDWLRVYLGWMTPRTLQIRVVILSNQSGPVLDYSSIPNPDPIEPGTSSVDKRTLDVAINEARRIFKAQANVTILPENNFEMVSTISTPAPAAALNPGCNWDGFVDGLGAAGDYYVEHLPGVAAASVTAFIVEDVGGKRGCSHGPVDDYVVVDPPASTTAILPVRKTQIPGHLPMRSLTRAISFMPEQGQV